VYIEFNEILQICCSAWALSEKAIILRWSALGHCIYERIGGLWTNIERSYREERNQLKMFSTSDVRWNVRKMRIGVKEETHSVQTETYFNFAFT